MRLCQIGAKGKNIERQVSDIVKRIAEMKGHAMKLDKEGLVGCTQGHTMNLEVSGD